jgi:predicted enzyme related to lactoylglutathione lyase
MLVVRDVEASSRRYQKLLGCTSGHGGTEYEQLHSWDVDHHHGEPGDPDARPYGNGVLLWFEIEDFDAAVERASGLGAEVVLAPHRNPPEGEPGGPAHREIWLRDVEGYTVVLASPYGEAPLRP